MMIGVPFVDGEAVSRTTSSSLPGTPARARKWVQGCEDRGPRLAPERPPRGHRSILTLSQGQTMPMKPPRLCGCGSVVPGGAICPCQRERKARADRARPSAAARGYTSVWQKASKRFLAKHPTCARCHAPATLVDHIKPHRGDQALFWDSAGNWQSLCTSCHSGAKQREECRNSGGPAWRS